MTNDPNTPTSPLPAVPIAPVDPLDQPAVPNHPALAMLPGPTNPDGTPQTMRDIQAELPEGAAAEAIDVSLRNLMVAPQKTIAALARKAYMLGTTGQPYVHHAVMAELGDGSDTMRILLLTAEEDRSPEALEREAAAKEAARHSREHAATLDAVFTTAGLNRRGIK